MDPVRLRRRGGPRPQDPGAVLLTLGARHIEVRSPWGTKVVDLDTARLLELRSIFDSAGVAVSAVASPIGKVGVPLPRVHKVQRLERIIEAAGMLGTGYIRIFSYFHAPELSAANIRDDVMERIAALAATAQEGGVVLLHENEKGIYGDTPERVLDIMETVDSPAMRAAWDNANFVQVGVRPYTDGYTMLRLYLEYLQVKDALAGSGTVVPTGQGDGELLLTMDALRRDGYAGFASLEPHLASAHELGGYSGPVAFGEAARAFRSAAGSLGIGLTWGGGGASRHPVPKQAGQVPDKQAYTA